MGAEARAEAVLYFLDKILRLVERAAQPAGAVAEPAEGAVEWVRAKLGFEPDEVQSRVLASTARRGMLNCTRQWGKSTTVAAKAVHEAYTKPGSTVVVVSPTGRQSGEFVRKAAHFLGKLGERARGDGTNQISLRLANGSRIVGLPGMEATVRGFSAVSLLLVDEAARVQDELYKAIRPMLAVSGGAMWLMSTPFGQRGFFYETWQSDEEWERVRVTAEECPRIPKEFLEEERKSLGDRWFKQEYLCEFVEVEAAIFDMELVQKAFRDDIEPLVLD